MIRYVFGLLLLASLALACPEDKSPSFPEIDAPTADAQRDSSDDDEEDEATTDCNDHDECSEDELCFQGECVDREEAISDCDTNDDCPDGWICIEEDHCEEE